jgi:WD40 repeat protein
MTAPAPAVKAVFDRAAEIESSAEREAYLTEACAGHPDVRREVEELLRAYGDAGSFLEAGPVAAPEDATAAFGAATADPAAATIVATVAEPASDRPARDRQVGAVIAGKYTLVEPIGEGGMGSVWRARQTEPVKRYVAVKLIKAGMDSRQVLARFEAERQALAMMDHPNIARVLDGGLHDGRPYFVMELVKGVPITEYCDTRRLTPRERLELFVPVCQAIQHAHQKGVIHRDIKPSNVLIALYDDRPVPKVIDFGVAKATGAALTEHTIDTAFGGVVGTPQYMSPEQATLNNLDIDTRSDVYALGVLLYELLTGSTPFSRKELEKKGVLEILRVVREEEPPRPSTKLSTADALPTLSANRGTEPRALTGLLRSELDWVVMKALEKDRSRRYETANAFVTDVRRYLAGEAVQAHPPGAGYRLRKFVRRHRAGVLSVLGVAVLLLAGAAATAWQAVVATRAERVASDERDAAAKARDAEAAARARTELALVESREKTARMTYERAQVLCEEGKADLGLLWMARSLELTPPGLSDLDRAIRTSMNLWAGQLNTVRPLPTAPEWERVANIEDVAVSPDGLSVLTVGVGGGKERQVLYLAQVWELSTGKLRFTLPIESDAPPFVHSPETRNRYRATFSPDGRFVAATRGDRRARIWTATSGQPVGKPLDHEDTVRAVGFDPAGKILATAVGKTIRVWSVERGVPDGELLGMEQEALGVEISGDGRYLLSWGIDQILVWDFPARKLVRTLNRLEFSVCHAGFSPDGRFVLANGYQTAADQTWQVMAQFWDVTTGQPVGERMTWRDHHAGSGGEPSDRSSFRPDGRVAVTGGFPVRYWSVPFGKSLGVTTASQTYGGAERPVFRRDGRVLVTIPFGLQKHLLDVAPALEPAQQLVGPGPDIADIIPGPDGRTIATFQWSFTQYRRAVRLFDVTTGGAIGAPIDMDASSRPGRAQCLPAFSADGRSVATGVGRNACQIWDAASGRERGPRLAMNSFVTALAFSPDGQFLAGGDWEGGVRLWNTTTGQAVGAPIVHNGCIVRLRFSHDGRKLLVAGGSPGGSQGEARLWDVATGQPLGPPLEIAGVVNDAAFSPDGKSFVTGSWKLICWDTATSQPLWTAPGADTIRTVAFSPDGRFVLARLQTENAARLFDARNGLPTGPHMPHQLALEHVALSPDGHLVLTCSSDRTARLWDAATGLPLGPPWANLTAIGSGCFAADGRSVWLAQGSELARWDIPAPLEGTPERVRLAVEAATRLSLDEYGGTLPLSSSLDDTVRKRLQELGDPPGYFRR